MRFIGDTTPVSSFTPALKLFDLMQKDFKFSIKNRLVIVPEVDKYRIKEDESIFNQVKTEKYDYEVYFDGEYVSAFNIDDKPERARIGVLKGLKTLYKAGKIHWNLFLYDIDKQKAKDKAELEKVQRKAKRKKPKTKEEKIVTAGIEKALKI
jgi:hypothetical protein